MRRSLTVILALLLFVPGGSQTKEVARVDSIDGAQGLSLKKGNGPWKVALVDTAASIGDHLKTDALTLATVQFYLGGRANLDKGTEISILNSKETKVESQTIQLNAGTFWAEFDKQKAPVQIQTAGGVMGIRGTEFVVGVDEEGETTLSLLEGEVEIFTAQGESHIARPGQRIRFGKARRLLTSHHKPEELLEKLKGEINPRLFRRRAQLRKNRMANKPASIQDVIDKAPRRENNRRRDENP